MKINAKSPKITQSHLKINEHPPVLVGESRFPTRLRSQFWRWTGALGWSLDFILLCWALFLRRAGLVDQGEAEDVDYPK